MKSFLYMLAVTAVVFITACSENTVSHDDGEEGLTARVEFSEGRIATLEEIEIDVYVETETGDRISDMSSIVLEHRVGEGAEWEEIDLTAHEDHFTSMHRFMTSGDHMFKVMGSRHEGDAQQVLYEMDDHMEIERAHMEMSGMLISFEHEGGEIHEGTTIGHSFWIEQMSGSGMMTGLAPTIICEESNGSIESHSATEMESGRYWAEHMFNSAGEATMTVEFMTGGMMTQASFSIPVAESH